MVDRPIAKALGESRAMAMKRRAQIASGARCVGVCGCVGVRVLQHAGRGRARVSFGGFLFGLFVCFGEIAGEDKVGVQAMDMGRRGRICRGNPPSV